MTPQVLQRFARLDERLEAVLALLHTGTHADIGSDHAKLPLRLIQTGRARRCIVVELNPGPLALARRNVARAGLDNQIDVRSGNGFSPLHPAEADSASITGMGAGTIAGILRRAEEGVLPPTLVLQPNDNPAPIRVWARESGYHLTDERLIDGYWPYPVLRLLRHPGPDLAYQDLPLAAALRYGPHLLREAGPLLAARIQADVLRLTPLAAPGRTAQLELDAAQDALKVIEP
ncbi:tRNA (adenine(22)-N(1))-methyltransferase TrmK [Deinococcus oregonensis]|uniref:tRNA (Adenine(22)-N(1))-methyltransferase TrmK n=1 Tax=Deinococcus oregonensis TaxID=1805970 RepID=A0ABV6AW33_9DEIO